LVHFTSEESKMESFVNGLPLKLCVYSIAFVIAFVNIWLIYQTARTFLM
jgi:manganese transport protein